MIAALIAACGTVAALVAAMVWLVTVIRADARDRADALVAAEKARGELAQAMAFHLGEVDRLAADVRRATRRADALEEWARGRISGGVDDGTDLLLAELSIAASATELDDDTDGDPGTGGAVHEQPAAGDSAGGSASHAALDDTLPGVGPP